MHVELLVQGVVLRRAGELARAGAPEQPKANQTNARLR